MNAAVFLDRDNTLIDNDGDLGDPEGVKLLIGAASALASLRGLGYRMIVVTNQGGVARGKYTEEDVDKVNQRISEVVKATSGAEIDAFYFCPYHPQGTVEKYKREHPWRKPAPGMLLQAAKDLNLDLSLSWMVGDQMRDVEAGLAAGTRTILLTPDAENFTPLRLEQIAAGDFASVQAARPHFRAKSLIEAVRIIAQQRTPEDVRLRQRAQTDAKPGASSPGLFGDMATQASATTPAPVVATVLPTPKSSSTRNIPRPAPVSPAKVATIPSAPPANEPVTPAVATSVAAVPAAAAEPKSPAAELKSPAKSSTSLLGDLSIDDDEPDESDALKGGMAPVGTMTSPAPAAPVAPAAPKAPAAPVAPPKPAQASVAAAPSTPVSPAAPATPPAAVSPAPARVASAPPVARPAPISTASTPAPVAPTIPASPATAAAPPPAAPPAQSTPDAHASTPAPPPAPVSAPAKPMPAAPPAPVAQQTSPAPATSEELAKIELTLREILREMRNHRGVDQEFSVLAVIATVLQMVAIVCFLGALVIGRGEGGNFQAWMYAAILLQLMTLTTLKFKK